MAEIIDLEPVLDALSGNEDEQLILVEIFAQMWHVIQMPDEERDVSDSLDMLIDDYCATILNHFNPGLTDQDPDGIFKGSQSMDESLQMLVDMLRGK